MDRDKGMFLVIGLLAGFICGYLAHEFMAARQPTPGWAARGGPVAPAAAGRPGPGTPGGGQQGSGATGGGQPAMEQVQQLAAHVRDNPDDARAIRQLADLNYDISNWQRAAELYSRYLELEGGNADVMTDLGVTLRFMGKPQEALEQFRAVRDLVPDHWQARYNEVLVLAVDLDDLAAASAALDELVSIQPDNPQVVRLAAELKKRTEGA